MNVFVPTMRRVVLDTPYTGWSWHQLSYTHHCMTDCMRRREAPMIAHLLYPPMFGPEGMEAGLSWESSAEAWVVYIDMGMTHNMKKSIERGYALGRPIEVRGLQDKSSAIVERVQRSVLGNTPLLDPTLCTHEVDTPRFDTDRTRRLLCWQCACSKVGPSVDEIRAVLREAGGLKG